ncbi:SMI1/KNR4 family protein [Streptomyces sp. NBC_01214]|uniref:hypothetical protein n=1 Tax=Streptomyces sp. NBC_01214 TaxID=2903777 RepID=UPI00225468D2|nr:hypothetical protein [Streptomyces sp. NBC_01214]MCX4808724.1 SMI1/KNR4 family protein [Streptomyces sp. NBC_01214]
MELTQSMLNDLLDRIDAPSGSLHLSLDTDPHMLVDRLADRYGAPRTLVLDGFTDPTVDESRGAALLAVLEGRGETIRAWAYGGQWIGAGTARDAQGVVRPVLAAAPRRVQVPATGGTGRDEDWVERLIVITAWTSPPQRPDIDWAQIEAQAGTRLPGDYKRMVETFGEGAFDGFLTLNQEPWTHLREDGLLIWASTEHENLYCWQTDHSTDPDRWSVAIRTFDDDVVPFDCSAAEFICRILLDPHHPFTMARYFDTHWFMNYRENE